MTRTPSGLLLALFLLAGCARFGYELASERSPATVDAGGIALPSAGAGGAGSAPLPEGDAAVAGSGAGGLPDASIPTDQCASDPNKLAAGVCGCGVADTDADADGTPDCVDACAGDANKLAAGVCGCGVADTDADADGTPDCVDACASDPEKSAPGECGCASPDTLGPNGAPLCNGIESALVHRYRFNGSGTTIVDSAGTANGILRNTSLTGGGSVSLAGGTSDQFVELPNALISRLTDATLEVWVTWAGSSQNWPRIFDFGESDRAEGTQGNGVSFLFLSPQGDDTRTNFMVLRYSSSGGTQVEARGTRPLAVGVQRHVVAVFDDTNDRLRLYDDGTLVQAISHSQHLSGINDVNNWLGRSQYGLDPDLAGALHEFRIYNRALTAAEVGYNTALGPDPSYLEP